MTAVFNGEVIDQPRTEFRYELIRSRAPNDDDARDVVMGPPHHTQ